MRLSVITVCFNRPANICDTLASVVAHTGRTLEAIRGHPWKPVRVISEPDRGIYAAMNKGLAMVAGDVVGTLNSDDVYVDKNVLAMAAKILWRLTQFSGRLVRAEPRRSTTC